MHYRTEIFEMEIKPRYSSSLFLFYQIEQINLMDKSITFTIGTNNFSCILTYFFKQWVHPSASSQISEIQIRASFGITNFHISLAADFPNLATYFSWQDVNFIQHFWGARKSRHWQWARFCFTPFVHKNKYSFVFRECNWCNKFFIWFDS